MQLRVDTETGAPVFYGKPLTFMEKSHRYKWNGEFIPSVTTILDRMSKPALIQWAANCAVDHIQSKAVWAETLGHVISADSIFDDARKAHATIRDAAGDVGTLVHKIAQSILGDRDPGSLTEGLTEEAGRALDAFNDWRNQHEIEPIALERRIFSKEHMYAGTCDFFGKIDGELAVLDFKTGGARIYDEAWLQLAGYLVALREELEELRGEPVRRWAVHLDKTSGKCTAVEREKGLWSLDREAWLAVVQLDRCMRMMRKAA